MPDDEPTTDSEFPVARLVDKIQAVTPLNVHVDFNELLRDYDEAYAYEVVGKLKDLLA